MLVKLFANNFGAFRDGFELDLEADNLSTSRDYGYFNVALDSEDAPLRLLRVAAIYGANASGKTTIINAARALYDLVVNSGPLRQQGDPIRAYLPFKLDDESARSPCELGCEVVVNGRVLEYRVAFTARQITLERITEYHPDGDRIWVDRTSPSDIRVNQEWLPEQTTIGLADVTRDNASVLSVAAMLRQSNFYHLFQELRSSLKTLFAEGLGSSSERYSLDKFHEDELFKNWAIRNLIAPSDLGITNAKVEKSSMPKEYLDELPDFIDRDKVPVNDVVEVSFFHKGDKREYLLDMASESNGTKKILALSGPWYDMTRSDITAFIDELSSSLHPSLLLNLLKTINNAPVDNRSQMIFNLHDLTPLDLKVLRRDQVYFSEKDANGVAKLYSLADFDERAENNFKKRYLEGRYGAIPQLPDQYMLFDEEATSRNSNSLF